ncbi:MAG: AbrB/MazE/SpoVT family DNA-binding domain-containing protein [Egibacteraceae bacterium]
MTYKIGLKGQVVIPKELRDELGIRPGDELVFWLEGDHLAARLTRSVRSLKGRFRGSALTEVLEAERQKDREREGRT